jgi:hypothetical protein
VARKGGRLVVSEKNGWLSLGEVWEPIVFVGNVPSYEYYGSSLHAFY